MKKRLISLFCIVLLTAVMLVGATTVTAKNKMRTIPTTIKEYLVNFIADNGGSATTDSQITDYIKNNKKLFIDIELPDTVTKFDGLTVLFNAMNEESCTVTFNCEEQSDFNLLLNEVNGKDYNHSKVIKFGKSVWDYILVIDASGLDVQPKFPMQRPTLKETGHFLFIDAIPEQFHIPVPIRVVNNSKEILGTQESTFNKNGMGPYDKDPAGVTVTREEQIITVKGLKTAAEIQSAYGAVWYTKDGAAIGQSPAANQVNFTFKTSIEALYSVSLEPITDGAKDGTPTLKLNGKTITGSAQTPKAEVPDKDEFGRSLGNTASLINRGTNSNQDKIGSNANGKDIRTGGRTNVTTGIRSLGFEEYGKKIEVAPNPDTANGFAVAYYNIEIYDPYTCELVKSEKNLTESQLKTILDKGIQGKTKIYVAYTNTATLLKTDAQGNAITNLNTSSAPEFSVYSNASCTKLIGKMTFDAKTGKLTTPVLDLPVPDNNETVKTYYIKETKAPAGYLVNDEVYKLEMQHTNSGLVKKLYNSKNTVIAGNGTDAEPWKMINYKVGYTMVKYRVTQYNKTDISKGKGKKAGDRTDGIAPYEYTDNLVCDGGERGFYIGCVVLYNVEFRNTGDVELTINVKDVFEKITKGGFEFGQVQAEVGGKKINVNGKDATTFTLPVNKAGTAEDESFSVITFTCRILDKTPAKEENSTGKTGYEVAGYENTATSTATFVSPYDGKTITYAEDEKGNVVPPETTGAKKEKSSKAYTPVMTKSVPTPTPTPYDNNDTPKTGDRSHSTLAIVFVVVAVVFIAAAVVFTVVNSKKSKQ